MDARSVRFSSGIALVPTLALTACGGTYDIDSRCTNDQVRAIQYSEAEWNSAAIRSVGHIALRWSGRKVDLQDPDDIFVRRELPTISCSPAEHSDNPQFPRTRGLTSREHRNVVIFTAGKDLTYFRIAVRHELGHLIGLKDLDQSGLTTECPFATMFYVLTDTPPTCADDAALRALMEPQQQVAPALESTPTSSCADSMAQRLSMAAAKPCSAYPDTPAAQEYCRANSAPDAQALAQAKADYEAKVACIRANPCQDVCP